ncbi:Fur family transcriptional regulator [Sulfurospirillum sp. 1612]|uniref:Fur family transcriptional regulator n=1 Tax=Sulfurospirillum sp. 1612 TaxID=3094835 RepID=UPI002F953484
MSHIELLKTHELKATPQRLCILNTLEECGHATLEEIQQIINEKFPTLSLSTIYRNINDMIQKEIVSEVKISNKKDYFEIAKENHVHLVCDECGRIEDFKIEADDLIDQVEKRSQSKVLSEILTFHVICKDCLKKMRK